ncbi:MAG: AEC family transporter [Clostridia bacterium]|nr:AEC family transporter [Clostridia bacterium]
MHRADCDWRRNFPSRLSKRQSVHFVFRIFTEYPIPYFYLTIGTLMGFRGNPLLVLAVLSSVPAAVNCFAMAKQMGVDAQITAFGVSITSLLSVVSIFISVYVIKLLGLA